MLNGHVLGGECQPFTEACTLPKLHVPVTEGHSKHATSWLINITQNYKPTTQVHGAACKQ